MSELKIISTLVNTKLGKLIFTWLLSQSTDVESKEEYDRSQADLTKFLNRSDTTEMIGEDCVNAVLDLQNTLRTKEYKLAGYRRNELKCGMDACTTSPVESNNNAIKHGPSGINSKMNLSKSVTRLLAGINNRYKRRKNLAKRQEYLLNLASRAPTREYVIPEGQALMDRNFDARLWCKSARISSNQWLVWNFHRNDHQELISHLDLYMTNFYRVRSLYTTENDDEMCFVKCSCGQQSNLGLPCECFFSIADNGKIDEKEIMDLKMIDCRWLRMFNAHYGEKGDIGDMLYEAQGT